jgi:hypothetical protein
MRKLNLLVSMLMLNQSLSAFACGPIEDVKPQPSGALHINFPSGEGFQYVNDDTGMVAALTVISYCNEPYVPEANRWKFGNEKLTCSKSADAKAIIKKAAERYQTYYAEMERLDAIKLEEPEYGYTTRLQKLWELDRPLLNTFKDEAKAKADLLKEFSDKLNAGTMTGKQFAAWYAKLEKHLNPENGFTESYFVGSTEDELPKGLDAGNDSRDIYDLSSSTGLTMPNSTFVSQCRETVDDAFLAKITVNLKNWVTTPGPETSLDPEQSAGAAR